MSQSRVKCIGDAPEPADPLDRVREFAFTRGLFERGQTLVVAVSGGPDSTALLHLLSRLSGELSLKLVVAHLNHGLRGAEADGDAEHVRQLAGSLGLPCIVETADVGGAARRLHTGIEEMARRIRQRFLERAADESGASAIALGHTLDDRVETVLLNVMRGCGTDGLAGLRPRSGRRVRPLLSLWRADTVAYCAANGIPVRHDTSNSSLAYARNRVRAELLPELASYYNPAVRHALLRLSEIAEADSAFLDEQARAAVKSAATEANGTISLDRHALLSLHPAVMRRALRLAVEQVGGTLDSVDFGAIEAIREAASCGDSTLSRTLPGALASVNVTPSRVVVQRHRAPACALPFAQRLQVPGVTSVPPLGIEVRVEARADVCPTGGSVQGREALVDAEQICHPLTVRNRRPGDRIQPLGMTGTRKVQDVLVDAKTPVGRRDRIPIICDAKGPIWVAGYVLSERVRITPGTTEGLRIAIDAAGSTAQR